MKRTVLVVGGSGFVGGAILRALAGVPGVVAINGVRRVAGDASGAVRRCDALDGDSVARAVQGVSCVVNATAGNPEAMQRATANICGAARAGGAKVIHLSSMAVYGAAEGLVCETARLDPDGSAYGAGKIACEAIVERFAADGGSAVILRPGIVHGPGGQQWTARLCRLLRAGRLGDLGAAGDGFCNLIHSDDVGRAAAAALQEDAAGAYNLASPDPPRWNEMFVRLGIAIGAVPVPRITAARLALESLVLAIPLELARRLGARAGVKTGALPDPLPRSLLALFAQHIRLDPRRADTLAFQRMDDARGLADSAAWFLAQARR